MGTEALHQAQADICVHWDRTVIHQILGAMVRVSTMGPRIGLGGTAFSKQMNFHQGDCEKSFLREIPQFPQKRFACVFAETISLLL